MWAWLPEELLHRIVAQLASRHGAKPLPAFAALERRTVALARVILCHLKPLSLPPFSLPAQRIVSNPLDLHLIALDLHCHHVTLLAAALTSGALDHLTVCWPPHCLATMPWDLACALP